MKHGDWILTCFLEPKQFDKFDEGSSDDFWTMDGSYHSIEHCGCKKISNEYAAFLNMHKFWEDPEFMMDLSLDKYDSIVMAACKKEGIDFEG